MIKIARKLISSAGSVFGGTTSFDGADGERKFGGKKRKSVSCLLIYLNLLFERKSHFIRTHLQKRKINRVASKNKNRKNGWDCTRLLHSIFFSSYSHTTKTPFPPYLIPCSCSLPAISNVEFISSLKACIFHLIIPLPLPLPLPPGAADTIPCRK